MKTRYLKKSIVSALCLTVMALVIPSIGMAQVGQVDCNFEPMFIPPIFFDIVASKVAVPGSISFSDPTGPANNPASPEWVSVPSTAVVLGYKIRADVYSQAMHTDITCDPANQRILNVQAIHDGTTILFKITFADPTQNITISDIPIFHDGLAIGIPYPVSVFGTGCTVDGGITNAGEILHMGLPCDGTDGFPCCPMQHMFWRADKAEIENILSNSPGTTIETQETGLGLLNTYQNWNAGTWTLILGRVMIDPYAPVNAYPFQAAIPGTNMVDLVPGEQRNIIFANWDGGIQERNGFKYVGVFGNLVILP